MIYNVFLRTSYFRFCLLLSFTFISYSSCQYASSSANSPNKPPITDTVYLTPQKPIYAITDYSNLTIGDTTVCTENGYNFNIPVLINANKIDSLKFRLFALSFWRLDELQNNMNDLPFGNGIKVWKQNVLYDSKKGIVTLDVEPIANSGYAFPYQIASKIYFTYDFIKGSHLKYWDVFDFNEENTSTTLSFKEEFTNRFRQKAEVDIRIGHWYNSEIGDSSVINRREEFVNALDINRIDDYGEDAPLIIAKNDSIFIQATMNLSNLKHYGTSEEWYSEFNMIGFAIRELRTKWKSILTKNDALFNRL